MKAKELFRRLGLVGSIILDEIQKAWWDFQDEHFSKHCKVCGIKLVGYFGKATTCQNPGCIRKFELRKHIDSILDTHNSDKNRHI